MALNEIAQVLKSIGFYEPVTYEGMEYRLCIRTEEGKDGEGVLLFELQDYDKEKLDEWRTGVCGRGVISTCLFIMSVGDMGSLSKEDKEKIKAISDEDTGIWFFDDALRRLIIYENQPADYMGIRKALEDVDSSLKEYRKAKIKNWWTDLIQALKAGPKVTGIIVLINIAVFIICTFTGPLLYNIGGVGISFIKDPIQLYRLITSMFLHADSAHIFGNMILLYFLGEIIENKMGIGRYLALYFSAGIFGSIFTFVNEVVSQKYVMVIGASGAVFGLLGALAALVLYKRVNRSTMAFGRVVVVIIFVVYESFRDVNVAVWSHIGGLVAGFFFGLIYCLEMQNKEKEQGKE